MFRLIGLVVSIGIADSINPTTIAPALYLASGERARQRVTQFTLSVFAVSFLAGTVIALGPGQLLLSLIPHPNRHTRYVIEVIVGVAMLLAGGLLWRKRRSLATREPPKVSADSRSSAILGATITAVELPTAFPYFAVIAAIVGSGLDPSQQLVLLLLFNLCFILPLLLIVATLWLAGERAAAMLTAGRDFLQRHWPVVLADLALLAGLIVVTLGVTGLGMKSNNDFGEFSRHIQHLLHFKKP